MTGGLPRGWARLQAPRNARTPGGVALEGATIRAAGIDSAACLLVATAAAQFEGVHDIDRAGELGAGRAALHAEPPGNSESAVRGGENGAPYMRNVLATAAARRLEAGSLVASVVGNDARELTRQLEVVDPRQRQVAELQDMGFSKPAAEAALALSGNSLEAAVGWLLDPGNSEWLAHVQVGAAGVSGSTELAGRIRVGVGADFAA